MAATISEQFEHDENPAGAGFAFRRSDRGIRERATAQYPCQIAYYIHL